MTNERPVGAEIDTAEAAPLARGPLRGRHVVLHPLEPAADAPPLFAATHGAPEAEAVWTYMGYGPFADAADMRHWMESCAGSEDPLFFAITEAEGGAPVGMGAYLRASREHRTVEIGHLWYVPRVQRGATNTETVYLLLRAAFERGYRRVEWKCDALNAASRRAALRLGFTFEGIFRQHLVVKGRNRDTAWFSLLDGEWPAARAAFEDWLAREPAERPSLAELRERRG